MKCIIKAELPGRIRVHAHMDRMSLEDADVLEYYLLNTAGVDRVKVYDRTCDAVITYSCDRSAVIDALAGFSFADAKAMDLVPEHTGRAISRMYQNRLVAHIAKRYLFTNLLPHNFRLALTVFRAISYVRAGLGALFSRRLNVDVLDASAITASILRDDHDTASSVMFLLGVGEIMEEWVRKKSITDLADMMSLNVDKVWLNSKDGEILIPVSDVGAGDEIMYLAKPHIGTDVLRTVIVNIRNKIESLGGEVRFNTRLDSLITENGCLRGIRISRLRDENGGRAAETIETEALILAVGHSARDTFAMINGAGIDMQQKPFSIGVRMEHPQAVIDASQYGPENTGRVTDALAAEREPGRLPPADYKINYKASNGRGVYSFCMCPGGEVVVCTTAEGELCVNGMSRRRRDSGTANSGILCDVRTEDFESEDVLAGVRFQEKYERLAFMNGGGNFTPPSCSMKDFLEGESQKARSVIDSLPDFASEALREAVPYFARRIHGYDDPDAVVTAVETRSSSPVRIVRDEAGESSIRGIYPAGEGAGYAGGITSAACDGIRAAWNIVRKFARPE